MKKFMILAVLILIVAFCIGCNNDNSESPAPTDPTMNAGGPMPGGPMPGGPMPGAPMPGDPMMNGGMPGDPMMNGGMPGDPMMNGGMDNASAAPAEETKEKELKTLEAEFPNASITRDAKGEVRTFYNPDAKKKTKSTGLTELQSREVALSFIRANYFYFDSMSFDERVDAGKYENGLYYFKWVQKIRDTKKTGNVIEVYVNPFSGQVVNYKSTKNNWTN